jgi:hypothetical protein
LKPFVHSAVSWQVIEGNGASEGAGVGVTLGFGGVGAGVGGTVSEQGTADLIRTISSGVAPQNPMYGLDLSLESQEISLALKPGEANGGMFSSRSP